MKFEYDKNKSTSNREKHGIDFEQAQELWSDQSRLEIRVQTEDEERWAVIGIVENRFWTAIVTYRKENCRIISVRRSRKNEENLYES